MTVIIVVLLWVYIKMYTLISVLQASHTDATGVQPVLQQSKTNLGRRGGGNIRVLHPSHVQKQNEENDQKDTDTTPVANHEQHTQPMVPKSPGLISALREIQQRHNTTSSEAVSPKEGTCSCVECDTDAVCGGLWRGTMPNVHGKGNDGIQFQHVHIVVSHCTSELGWLSGFVKDIPTVKTMTVYSKCNQQASIPADVQSSIVTSIHSLPNKGGCDHSYLYWITQEHLQSQDHNSPDVVVFIKDTFRPDATELMQPGVPRSLSDMLRIVAFRGFGCAVELHRAKWENTSPDLSTYHVTKKLRDFALMKYQRTLTQNQQQQEAPAQDEKKENGEDSSFHTPALRKFGKFTKYFEIDLPKNLTEVCYGGGFAVDASRFKEFPLPKWEELEKALKRGDNIEESHHMERSWAAILSPPLGQTQIDALWQHSTGVAVRRGSIMGALKREDLE